MLNKLIVAYGLFGFGDVVTTTFMVAMAKRLDHTILLESLTWIAFGLIAAPSLLLWQRLALRLGVFSALRLAYGIEAVGVLLAGFGTGHLARVTGSALLGGTCMGMINDDENRIKILASNNPPRSNDRMVMANDNCL